MRYTERLKISTLPQIFIKIYWGSEISISFTLGLFHSIEGSSFVKIVILKFSGKPFKVILKLPSVIFMITLSVLGPQSLATT